MQNYYNYINVIMATLTPQLPPLQTGQLYCSPEMQVFAGLDPLSSAPPLSDSSPPTKRKVKKLSQNKRQKTKITQTAKKITPSKITTLKKAQNPLGKKLQSLDESICTIGPYLEDRCLINLLTTCKILFERSVNEQFWISYSKIHLKNDAVFKWLKEDQALAEEYFPKNLKAYSAIKRFDHYIEKAFKTAVLKPVSKQKVRFYHEYSNGDVLAIVKNEVKIKKEGERNYKLQFKLPKIKNSTRIATNQFFSYAATDEYDLIQVVREKMHFKVTKWNLKSAIKKENLLQLNSLGSVNDYIFSTSISERILSLFIHSWTMNYKINMDLDSGKILEKTAVTELLKWELPCRKGLIQSNATGVYINSGRGSSRCISTCPLLSPSVSTFPILSPDKRWAVTHGTVWNVETLNCSSLSSSDYQFLSPIHLLTKTKKNLKIWNLEKMAPITPGIELGSLSLHRDDRNGLQVLPSGKILTWQDSHGVPNYSAPLIYDVFYQAKENLKKDLLPVTLTKKRKSGKKQHKK